MPRYIYTMLVRLEVAGDNRNDALLTLTHALAHARKGEVVTHNIDIVDQRDEELSDQ